MPHRCVIYIPSNTCVAIGVPIRQRQTPALEELLYIHAWGSALLVSTCRAIPGASERGASDSAGLHAFLCLEFQSFLINLRVAEVLSPTKL